MSGHETDDAPWDDLDIAAAEYTLGVLDHADARALEALSFQDDTVAAAIARWEDRLAPLLGAVAPVPPPPLLWRRLALAAGLDGAEAPRRGVSRVWRSVSTWRMTTAGAAAVAACLAYLIWSGPQQGQLMAALAPPSGPAAAYLVRVLADGSATVAVTGAGVAVPQGRALELWAVREAGSAPVSLGLLPPSGRASFRITEPAQTQLLVSQEPAGGAPNKQPTGPVVFTGVLTEL